MDRLEFSEGAVRDYCEQALVYLSLAHDPERAMFSYSSSLDTGGNVVNDFAMPTSLRYTINTYLGLGEAERHRGEIEWLGPVRDRVDRFIDLHETALESPADLGLLLVLLAATDRSHPAAGRALDRLGRTVGGAVSALNMQDLSWMLWGASAWAEDGRAEALARRLFELIGTRYVHPETGLPRHSRHRYRAHTVSFGSIVYFLRAMSEYSSAFESREARDLFMRCVRGVLGLQAEDGAWPWLMDVRTGVPIDLYPIFSVHQDSMAMLFLFPAREAGVEGADEAIARSVDWNFGHNELGESLVLDDPCAWFYRSIERTERWPRARRYLRGVGRATRSCPPRSPNVRLNRECRSYHLGWVLYAWSQDAWPDSAFAARAETHALAD